MLELIVSYLARGLMLIAGLYLYVFWMAHLLPKALLCREKKVPTDRALKKYVFSDGRAIVYEPSSAMQPYVSQYILSVNQGEKYIQCKIDQAITSIKYEVQAFDHQHKYIHTVDIEEDEIKTPGFTQNTRLSRETSYVNVIVCAINGTSIHGENISKDGWIKIAIFSAAAVLSSVVMGKIIQTQTLVFANLISPGGTFTQGPAFLRAIPFLAGVLYALFTLLGYYRVAMKTYTAKFFQGLFYRMKTLFGKIMR